VVLQQKKFDGVSFRVNDNKIKLLFEGGLNALNKINPPQHMKIQNIDGDLPLDE